MYFSILLYTDLIQISKEEVSLSLGVDVVDFSEEGAFLGAVEDQFLKAPIHLMNLPCVESKFLVSVFLCSILKKKHLHLILQVLGSSGSSIIDSVWS